MSSSVNDQVKGICIAQCFGKMSDDGIRKIIGNVHKLARVLVIDMYMRGCLCRKRVGRKTAGAA